MIHWNMEFRVEIDA